jgi:hypothetical protein
MCRRRENLHLELQIPVRGDLEMRELFQDSPYYFGIVVCSRNKFELRKGPGYVLVTGVRRKEGIDNQCTGVGWKVYSTAK